MASESKASTNTASINDDWYRSMVEEARAFAILSLDTEGNIVTWNSGAQRLFRYSPEEIVGQPAAVVFTAEDQATGQHGRELSIAAAEGQAEDDRWHVRKDGSRFWATGWMMAMREEGGLVRGFVKIIQDKTDEKRMEESLRMSEEQFARVVLGNPAAMALERFDREQFVLANEAFFKLTGYWRAEVMGRSGSDLGLWADGAQRSAMLKRLRAGETVDSTRFEIRAKSGEITRCLAAFSLTGVDNDQYVLGTFIPEA